MLNKENLVYETTTQHGLYQVIDMKYEGRKARILFTGKREAAFSGIPLDGEHDLLFDYIQRLYEITSTLSPKNILMIGGGVYTLPSAIINTLPETKIDVVEIDKGLNEIAEAFFGFMPNERMNIIHTDGRKYLNENQKKYDMIIIDVFSDLEIPMSMRGQKALSLIHDALTNDGVVAMNIISSYKGRNYESVREFSDIQSTLYPCTNIYQADSSLSLWATQNLILVSQKSMPLKNYGIRRNPLEKIPVAE